MLSNRNNTFGVSQRLFFFLLCAVLHQANRERSSVPWTVMPHAFQDSACGSGVFFFFHSTSLITSLCQCSPPNPVVAGPRESGLYLCLSSRIKSCWATRTL